MVADTHLEGQASKYDVSNFEMDVCEMTNGGRGWAPGLAGRRPRLSEEEVRRRVLDTAVGLVEASGLTVSLEHLSYEVVIQEADVPRSAVYRVWATKEAFFQELLCELAGPKWQGTGAFDRETLDLAIYTVAKRASDLVSVAGRREALLEAARVGAKQNFQALSQSVAWRTYVALTATVTSLPEGTSKNKLLASLQESEAYFLDAMASFYDHMSARLGYRLKPELRNDYRLLAAIGAAVVEGLGLRQIIAPDIVSTTLELHGFGATQQAEWSIPAFGYTAIIDAMIESDPEFDESRVPVIQDELRMEAARIRAKYHWD